MIAAQSGIQGIPTIVVFNGGKEIARQAGAMDFESLIRWVKSHIS